MIPAPRVTGTHTDSSDRCREREFDGAQGQTVVQLPPAPGLRAAHVGRRVVVDLDTGMLPAACAPATIVVLLANTRGHAQVMRHDLAIQQLGPARFELPTPAAFSAPVDVVRAYAVTREGREGDGTAVAVTG